MTFDAAIQNYITNLPRIDAVVASNALSGHGSDWGFVPAPAALAYNDVAEMSRIVDAEIERDARDLKIDGREG